MMGWGTKSMRASLFAACLAMFFCLHSSPGWAQRADGTAVTIRPRLAHSGNLQGGVAFSKDGTKLVSAASDGEIFVWDINAGAVIRVLPAGQSAMSTIHLSASDLLAVSGGNARISIYDLASGQIVRDLAGNGEMKALGFSPDGQLLAVLETPPGADSSQKPQAPTLALWDVASGTRREVLAAAGDIASFAKDGTLVTAGSGGEIRFWNAKTGEKLRTITANEREFLNPEAIALAPAGDWLVTAPDRNARAYGTEGDPRTNDVKGKPQTFVPVRDAQSGKLLRVLKFHQNKVGEVAISPKGDVIASVGDNLKLWDAASGKVLATFDGARPAFNAGGTRVATTVGLTGIEIRDARSGTLIKALGQPAPRVNAVKFSGNGNQLAIAVDERSVSLWDFRAARMIFDMRQEEPATSLSFAPSGDSLLVGNSGVSITVWDARSGKQVKKLSSGNNTPPDDKITRRVDENTVAYSPDAARIAVGGSHIRRSASSTVPQLKWSRH